jgi:hypothetical protein
MHGMIPRILHSWERENALSGLALKDRAGVGASMVATKDRLRR